MKKIVVCPDSFKGSLSAKEVTQTIAKSIKEIHPEIEVIELPLADGGEGTAEILTRILYPKIVFTKTHDPLGRVIKAKYYLDLSGKKAFIQSSDIIGLTLLTIKERNPLIASSYGLGEIIKKSIKNGVQEITVSLGGSATCDGGIGMLKALGDSYKGVKFNVVCDVNSPLLGEKGAVKVFAPQKGAKPEDIPILEKRLETFFKETHQKGYCGKDDAWKEGAGCAGGIGFTFLTYLKAHYVNGIDFILQSINFNDLIKGADFIITGEGKIDKQSLMGKVLTGVVREASKEKIPVIAIAGIIEDEELLRTAGIHAIYSIYNPKLSIEENMKTQIATSNLKKKIKCLLDFQ